MLRILHAAIGVLLLVAGIGKLLALLGPVETLGWPTWLVVLGGSVEVLLGTALVIGYARRAIHLITLATFGLFSILSLIQTLRGVESCGCLARLHVHPAWMLTFDLILVIALASLTPRVMAWRSARETETTTPIKPDLTVKAVTPTSGRWARPLGVVGSLLVSAIVAGLAGLGAIGAGGTPAVALVSPRMELGEVLVGTHHVVTAKVANPTDQPIRLIGGENSCACLITGGLPVELASGATAEIPLTVKPFALGEQVIPFEIWTNRPVQPRVFGLVTYTGVAAREDSETTFLLRDRDEKPVETSPVMVTEDDDTTSKEFE